SRTRCRSRRRLRSTPALSKLWGNRSGQDLIRLEAPRMYKNLLLAAVSVVALGITSTHVWADDGSNNDGNGGAGGGNDNKDNNPNQTAGNDNNNSDQNNDNSNQGNDTGSSDGNQNYNVGTTAIGGDWLTIGGDGINASNGHNSAVAEGDVIMSISALSANVSNNPF